jgi:hypothetical protein
MTRAEMVREIRIAARLAALRRLAAETAEAYDQTDSGLPPRHRELRRMLLGRLLPPPRKGD